MFHTVRKYANSYVVLDDCTGVPYTADNRVMLCVPDKTPEGKILYEEWVEAKNPHEALFLFILWLYGGYDKNFIMDRYDPRRDGLITPEKIQETLGKLIPPAV